MEKAKNDYTPRRSLLKRMMIFVGMCVLVVFGLVVSLTLAMVFILGQTSYGEFVEELPLELVPTAESLLKHPLPTPEYLFINEPITVGDDKDVQTRICVLKNVGIFFSSRLFLNGSRILSDMTDGTLLDVEPRNSTPIGYTNVSYLCATVSLEQGLHLFGFQPDVLALYPIYQWAIEVK